MELFDFLNKIVDFQIKHRLPCEVYIYDHSRCEYLRGHMKNLHGESWPLFKDDSTMERLIYGGHTFYLADIQ